MIHVELVAKIDVEGLFNRLTRRDEKGDLPVGDIKSFEVRK